MRAVIQRVLRASVSVDGKSLSSVGAGWLILLGVGAADSVDDAQYLADKILNLRAFPDEAGKMNRSVLDVRGELLAISQFTLFGDCRSGRRPGFSDAAPAALAQPLYDQFCAALETSGLKVGRGQFQADMQVDLCNDGPVTFILDSKKQF